MKCSISNITAVLQDTDYILILQLGKWCLQQWSLFSFTVSNQQSSDLNSRMSDTNTLTLSNRLYSLQTVSKTWRWYWFVIIHFFFSSIIMIFFHFFSFYFLTLQYCIGFAIYQHESATGIHVFPILKPPPFPYHPSGSSQCTSPKHPVSCIKPGLATRFINDVIHVIIHVAWSGECHLKYFGPRFPFL